MGSMESADVVEMFGQSVEMYKLRYTSYIGDGDTSSYNCVEKSQPYGLTLSISKKAWIGWSGCKSVWEHDLDV